VYEREPTERNCVFRGPGAVVTFPNILASFLTSPSGLDQRARSRA